MDRITVFSFAANSYPNGKSHTLLSGNKRMDKMSSGDGSQKR
jgi:hypothetical protein